MPVEKNVDGRCIIDEWDFFYRDWLEDTINTKAVDDNDNKRVDDNNAEFFDAVGDSLVDSTAIDNCKDHDVSDDGDDGLSRCGVTDDEMFPKSRLGSLDVKVLKKLGLTSSTMKTNYFLFFLQLILPMCDPERSGVESDGRLPYYSKLEEW